MQLSLMDTIEALLNDGIICVSENKLGTKRTYKVMLPSKYIKGTVSCIGKTTERNTKILLKKEFITPMERINTDKYGNKSWYYRLNTGREKTEEGK